MRMIPTLALFVLFGAIFGYSIGVNKSLAAIILSILMGAFYGSFLGAVLLLKRYSALVWSVATSLIALIVDWLAGSSSVSMMIILIFATLGIYIGIDFRPYWRQILAAGCIGGILGFIWGMNGSTWFGNVHLEPGLFNASLLFVEIFVFGMFFGSSYMKWIEPRHEL